jgi:exosortase
MATIASKQSTSALASRSRSILFAVMLAHVPMLLSYFRTLWSYQHFQFFPFALVACVLLFRNRIDWNRIRLSKASWVLLLADLAFVVLSCAVGSPWLAVVGFACSVWALACASVDATSERRPWELGLLFLSVVRPPAGLDLEIVQKLQSFTTVISSDLLDRLGVLHIRSGNLIELPTKRLFVEEACSGVQSLFAILFVGLLVIAVRRRSPLHAFALLCSTAICAIPMNIARVVLIALAWDSWQLDLSEGTGHTVLGYVLLAVAAVLVLSADRCWRFLSEPISTEWRTSYGQRQSPNPIMSAWDWCWSNFRSATATGLDSYKLTFVASAVVSIACCGWQCVSLFAGEVASLQVPAQLFAGAQLPKTLGTLELKKRDSEQRSRSNNQGQYSENWRYEMAGQDCLIACDYPFTGWHSLETCYTGIGWQVEDKQLVGDPDWPAMAISLSKPGGERGYLVYSFFDGQGRTVRPKSAVDPAATIGERLMRGNWKSVAWQTYQAQIFCTGPTTSSKTTRLEILKAHEASRERLRLHLTGQQEPPQ